MENKEETEKLKNRVAFLESTIKRIEEKCITGNNSCNDTRNELIKTMCEMAFLV